MNSLNIGKLLTKMLPAFGILFVLYCSDDYTNEAELSAAAMAVINGSESPIPVPSGDPVPPGQSENAPDLQDFTIVSFDISNPSENYYKGLFTFKTINFVSPIHDNTAISGFIGGQDMELLPDNTVVNSLSHWTSTSGNIAEFPGSPPALIALSDRRYKILVVARNEFGISSKMKQGGQSHFCAGAAALPATVGDCGTLCAKATLSVSGDEVLFKSQYKISQDIFFDLYTDIQMTRPTSFSFPVTSLVAFEMNDTNVPIGTYEAKSSLNITKFEYMCVEVSSMSYVVDSANMVSPSFVKGKVFIP
ncbi:hypothetical protein [Leptospira licerasiae]|uniref:hypothetical protein n=1 Tax=Leptospira licerasiae TaxID=447106 RepID=UPI0010828017|nr:hypothetical protein [Leptospira licerasiae]TGM94909.1 hypothetical protein EHR05_02295 [Leptospira licerasiae]